MACNKNRPASTRRQEQLPDNCPECNLRLLAGAEAKWDGSEVELDDRKMSELQMQVLCQLVLPLAIESHISL